jgi:hypothetical protein
LVGFCRVCGGGGEFVCFYEVLHFGVVLFYWYDDKCVAFIFLCDRGFAALEFGFYASDGLASCWALGVGVCLLSRCSVIMRSATCFLYTSRSAVGRCVIAFSASRATFFSQSVRFVCRLYLSPFCRIATFSLWIRETGTGQQVTQLRDRYDDDDDDDDNDDV